MYKQIVDLLNSNPGVVSVLVFISTLAIAWLSGLFRVIRQKPKLKIQLLEGPTFVCVFGTEGEYEGYKTHGVGIALYMRISNVGVSPTSIAGIKVGYHWNTYPNLRSLIRYRLGWFYLADQIVALADFQALVGENTKIYPFLTQKGFASGSSAETYLEPGNIANGVAYFEQRESWGRCYPISRNRKTKIKIVVSDIFERKHKFTTKIDRVSLEEAKKYNPKFGMTMMELHELRKPVELPMDKHGNLIDAKMKVDGE